MSKVAEQSLHGGRFDEFLESLSTSVHLKSLVKAFPWLGSMAQASERLADPLAVLDLMTLEWKLNRELTKERGTSDKSNAHIHTSLSTVSSFLFPLSLSFCMTFSTTEDPSHIPLNLGTLQLPRISRTPSSP